MMTSNAVFITLEGVDGSGKSTQVVITSYSIHYTKLYDFERPLGEELLTPTRIYVKPLLNLLRNFQIKAMAHITGGGLLENVPRVLPRNCRAVFQKDSWPKPAIFEVLREGGNIPEEEMYRTFNYSYNFV